MLEPSKIGLTAHGKGMLMLSGGFFLFATMTGHEIVSIVQCVLCTILCYVFRTHKTRPGPRKS